MFPLESQEVNQQLQKNQEIVSSFDISQFTSIREAFVSLTANVSKLLQSEDFYAIRRSCIEQIHTPSGAQLSSDMVQKIKIATDLNALLDTLADSPYWSWIDLRLLETMVAASGSHAAKDLIISYQKSVFSKRLIDVLPSIPNNEASDAFYSKIVSKVHKDIKEVTVFDLLRFQTELETVIMGLKSGTCALGCIDEGSIVILWYIPNHCINHAYQSACLMSDKFQDFDLQYLQIGPYKRICELPTSNTSQAITTELSCPVNVGKIYTVTGT